MKMIIITQDQDTPEEVETIHSLVNDGVIVHIRKKTKSETEMIRFLEQFTPQELSGMTLHGFPELAAKFGLGGIHTSFRDRQNFMNGWSGRRSVSCHSLQELAGLEQEFDYAFLSPIYDSISKPGYKAAFNLSDLDLSLYRAYALGGITIQKLPELEKAGFSGVAICGDFWLSGSTSLKEYLSKSIVHE